LSKCRPLQQQEPKWPGGLIITPLLTPYRLPCTTLHMGMTPPIVDALSILSSAAGFWLPPKSQPPLLKFDKYSSDAIGFIMCRSYKIALYRVLLSAVDGEILLLPVRVRHVENARALLPTLLYSSATNSNSYLLHLSTLRACFIAIHV